jgi:hypothetical protein
MTSSHSWYARFAIVKLIVGSQTESIQTLRRRVTIAPVSPIHG